MRRSSGSLAILGCAAATLATVAVDAPAVALMIAREVRSIDTVELGLHAPVGVSYSAGDGSLVVIGSGAEGPLALRMTTAGDKVSIADGPGVSEQSSRAEVEARHPSSGLTYVLNTEQQEIQELRDDGTLLAAYRLDGLNLVDPRAMTFAPSADTTDDPARQHLFIADAGDRSRVGEVKEVSLESGVALAATVPVVTTELRQVIDTSAFSPGSPDPSGIVYLPGTDRMQVVDSEVDETTGAGYHQVNLWQITRTGTVTDTGTTWTGGAGFTKEPTGLGFDPATNTLLISDDSNDRVWLDRPGPDTRFGTADDVVTFVNAGAYGSGDTEDPEFDPATGHLFFIDGTNLEVYEVDPVNGVFGDGNDVMTHFDVAVDGMRDIEGLSSDAGRGTLLVGDRNLEKIFEYTKAGVLQRIIDASATPGMTFISGLGRGPASDGSGTNNYWVVDRAVDNSPNPAENDGKIFELRVAADGPAASPPSAIADTATTAQDTPVVINVAANDSDPDGNLVPSSVSVTVAPTSGTATPNGNGTVTYTPAAGFFGSDGFTYQICDTTSLCATATVGVTVIASGDPPTALADTATTAEDTAVIVDVAANDSDPDGNLVPSSVSVTVGPASGTATPNGDGTVTYTPAAGFFGSDGFTYQICDTTSLCATATVGVTVSAVDDPPVATADTAKTPQNAAVIINVAANDSDPDGNLVPSSVSVTVAPASGTATPNGDGTVTYTPAAGFEGSDGFTYEICDTSLLCATATVGITVGGVNRYYVSLKDSGIVPGIAGTVRDEDIIVYDRATNAWSMYFDASDVGITISDVKDFHLRPDGGILLSFSEAINVPGLVGGPDLTLIDDSDIVLFTPTSTGTNTAGTFSFFFDGSDVGLEANSEELDGIHELADGTLALSLTGTASGPGLAGADEDVLLFTPTGTGATTTGTWTTLFDGSDVGLTAGTDDLDAISFDTNGDLMYSTTGTNTVPGTTDEDINRFTGTFGPVTSGTATLDLALAALGVSTANNVDGLHTSR